MALDRNCPAFYLPKDPNEPWVPGVYTGYLSTSGEMIYLEQDRGGAMYLVTPDEIEPLTEAAKDMMLCALGVSWGRP